MKRILMSAGVFLLLAACTGQLKETGVEAKQTIPALQEGDVMAGVNLTVAEGKRLIAKGIANLPQVKERLKSGTIVITTGSTNTYVAEELIGLAEPHGSFVIGYITPRGKGIPRDYKNTKDIVIINGEWVDTDFAEVLRKADENVIVFKGANILNYEKKQSAVYFTSEDGGPARMVNETRAQLIIPIGLEKEIFGDLNDYAQLLDSKNERLSSLPRLWIHKRGEIFTEIEAIKAIASVNVVPYAAGGIAGREGGVSFAVYGKREEVQKVLDFVATIQGEAPFIE